MQNQEKVKYLAFFYNNDLFLINTQTKKTQKNSLPKQDILSEKSVFFLNSLNFLYNYDSTINVDFELESRFLDTYLYFLEDTDNISLFNTNIHDGNFNQIYKYDTLEEFGLIFCEIFEKHKDLIYQFLNNKEKYKKFFKRYLEKDIITYKLQKNTHIIINKKDFDRFLKQNPLNNEDYYYFPYEDYILYVSSYRYKHITTNRLINYGLINFFTNKETRSLIKSNYSKGLIYNVDINSFELRIFLQIFNKELYEKIKNEDLYEYFSRKISMDRKTTKIGILSFIYGAGIDKLKNLNIDIEKLKNLLFNKESTFRNKIKNFIRKNKIITPFNSVIKKPEKYKIINYLVQSTAADIIFDTTNYILKNQNTEFNLCLNIYDSFIFNVNKSEIKDETIIKHDIDNFVEQRISSI